MGSSDIITIIFTSLSIVAVAIVFLPAWRASSRRRLATLLALAIGMGVLSGGVLVVAQQGWLQEGSPVVETLSMGGMLAVALSLMVLTAEFLAVPTHAIAWNSVGFLMLLAALATLIGGAANPGVEQALPRLVAAAGWVFILARAAWVTFQGYRQARQPLHRNRISYWGFTLLLIAAAGLFYFFGLRLIGASIQLLGLVVIAYVGLVYDLEDFGRTVLRLFNFLLISLFAILVYTVVMVVVPRSFSGLHASDIWSSSLIVATALVLLINPLFNLMGRGLERVSFGSKYDASAIVREYSLAVSNILDLERLAAVSVGHITKALGIARGCFFLVEEAHEGGNFFFRLQGLKFSDDDVPPAGMLRTDSPVAVYLNRLRRPLIQYDIDMHAQFRQVAEAERHWLASLGMDIFVPVYSKDRWTGLLALGPKTSGDRYFDPDLVLLSTLADQTAVALQNARLFADMRQLNTDLARTHHALEQAHQQLTEVDALKSAFIGVITHEMRTPLANLVFSLQLLEMYSKDSLTSDQLEQIIQLKTGVAAARKMVDNLVIFASFLNHQVTLRFEPINFVDVLKDVLPGLRSMAEGKGVGFKVEVLGGLIPIIADRKMLGEAVYQLVHNGIKFTNPGGKVLLSCWEASDILYFDIKDTGIGIPENKLPDLWKGFTQAADPLRRGLEGLGLGLALVKFIITAHKGEVWAENNVSTSGERKGSDFGFHVPIAGPKGFHT